MPTPFIDTIGIDIKACKCRYVIAGHFELKLAFVVTPTFDSNSCVVQAVPLHCTRIRLISQIYTSKARLNDTSAID